MNSIQACFLFGFLIGCIIAGTGVYKWEEVSKLEIQKAQQAALVVAQNNIINKEREAQSITQKVSQEYEAKFAAITAANKLQPKTTRVRVSKISKSAGGIDATCKLRLHYLQDWIKQQTLVYNK